jgi:hypothetical protein
MPIGETDGMLASVRRFQDRTSRIRSSVAAGMNDASGC